MADNCKETCREAPARAQAEAQAYPAGTVTGLCCSLLPVRIAALRQMKSAARCLSHDQGSVTPVLRLQPGEHPNAGEGLWGTEAEVPSFLYAMPTDGGRRVFLEETCLVAKPALPFAVLKRRLERRLKAMGIKVFSQGNAMCSHIEAWS